MEEKITINGVEYARVKTDKLGQIKKYIKENPLSNYCSGQPRIKSEKIILPYPSCNDDWTYEVWNWVKTFCKKFEKAYPTHYPADNNKEQIIDIESYYQKGE